MPGHSSQSEAWAQQEAAEQDITNTCDPAVYLDTAASRMPEEAGRCDTAGGSEQAIRVSRTQANATYQKLPISEAPGNNPQTGRQLPGAGKQPRAWRQRDHLTDSTAATQKAPRQPRARN